MGYSEMGQKVTGMEDGYNGCVAVEWKKVKQVEQFACLLWDDAAGVDSMLSYLFLREEVYWLKKQMISMNVLRSLNEQMGELFRQEHWGLCSVEQLTHDREMNKDHFHEQLVAQY